MGEFALIVKNTIQTLVLILAKQQKGCYVHRGLTLPNKTKKKNIYTGLFYAGIFLFKMQWLCFPLIDIKVYQVLFVNLILAY